MQRHARGAVGARPDRAGRRGRALCVERFRVGFGHIGRSAGAGKGPTMLAHGLAGGAQGLFAMVAFVLVVVTAIPWLWVNAHTYREFHGHPLETGPRSRLQAHADSFRSNHGLSVVGLIRDGLALLLLLCVAFLVYAVFGIGSNATARPRRLLVPPARSAACKERRLDSPLALGVGRCSGSVGPPEPVAEDPARGAPREVGPVPGDRHGFRIRELCAVARGCRRILSRLPSRRPRATEGTSRRWTGRTSCSGSGRRGRG